MSGARLALFRVVIVSSLVAVLIAATSSPGENWSGVSNTRRPARNGAPRFAVTSFRKSQSILILISGAANRNATLNQYCDNVREPNSRKTEKLKIKLLTVEDKRNSTILYL